MKVETAKSRIEAFRNRFGDSHFTLLCHAAFPLALTPDLLYRIWANFQRDVHNKPLSIPWLAVADVLLSNLCNEVGYELYEMPKEVRTLLLNELKSDSRFGTKRAIELSDFLLIYIRDQLESHDPDIRDFAETQKWTALAFTRPGQALCEIRKAVSQINQHEKSEVIRMKSLLETLIEPLEDFDPLFVSFQLDDGAISQPNQLTEMKQIVTFLQESLQESSMQSVLSTSSESEEALTEHSLEKEESITETENIKEQPHPFKNIGYSYKDFDYDANCLYAHVLELRKKHPPQTILDSLPSLLSGFDPNQGQSLAALTRIVNSEWADRDFRFILNRCCYILINYWWLRPDSRWATTELLNIIQNPPATSAYSPVTHKLRLLVQQFTQTEQFQALLERAELLGSSLEPELETTTLGDLAYRYPYLYPHRLLEWDETDLGPDAIQRVQKEKEEQFERSLQRYALSVYRQTGKNDTVESAPNPTLLADLELNKALQSFAGETEGLEGYRNSVRDFLEKQVPKARTYGELKELLHLYLIDSIRYSSNPKYGEHNFNKWLHEQLSYIFPNRDDEPPNADLLVQTCDRLIGALIASPNRKRNHFVFIDLNTNLGATFTVGLILKLVLICCIAKPKVKETIQSRLAMRLAVLVEHYEHQFASDVNWLVECLENWFVARTTYFGQTGSKSWARLFQK